MADPTRLIEFFYVATWREHLRQRCRFTRGDQAVEAQICGPEPPQVSHFLAFPKTAHVEVPSPPVQLAESGQ